MKEGIIYTLAENSKRECLEELKKLLYNGSLTMVSYIRISNNLFLSLKRNYSRKKFLKKIVDIIKKELGDFDIKIILDLRLGGDDFKKVSKVILKYYDYVDALTFSGELKFSLLPEIKENFPKLELILCTDLEEEILFQKGTSKSCKILSDLNNIIERLKNYKNYEEKVNCFCDFVVIPTFDNNHDSKYNQITQGLATIYEIGIIKEQNSSWVILPPE